MKIQKNRVFNELALVELALVSGKSGEGRTISQDAIYL